MALAMKILIEGNHARYEKFMPPEIAGDKDLQLIYCPRGSSDEERLKLAGDAEVFLADAISVVGEALLSQMPNLKLLHSEGVAFNSFDAAAARRLGIDVCNCKGCNASAVAEQTVLLMLMLLRHSIIGDTAVREGRQIQVKEHYMVHGIRELSECRVGLIGVGDIGSAAAGCLKPFGCQLAYYSPHRRSQSWEEERNITYMELDQLICTSDFISLHCAVTEETRGMVDRDFLHKMKPGSYLINTARGALVDNEALREAILSGHLAGAGLDTLDPEPMQKDNPVINLPAEFQERVVFSPHLGGITTGSFRRAHRMIWDNVLLVKNGEKPLHVVN